MKTIEVRTDLLLAVAKWAHGDSAKGIGSVLWRNGRMVATDCADGEP